MIAQTAGLVEEFTKLGFSPMAALIIVAFGGLIAYLKTQLSAQNLLRESWHADTRHQMEKVERKVEILEKNREDDRKRIDECEDDRNALNAKVKALSDEIVTFKDCSYQECPFRRKRNQIPL